MPARARRSLAPEDDPRIQRQGTFYPHTHTRTTLSIALQAVWRELWKHHTRCRMPLDITRPH